MNIYVIVIEMLNEFDPKFSSLEIVEILNGGKLLSSKMDI